MPTVETGTSAAAPPDLTRTYGRIPRGMRLAPPPEPAPPPEIEPDERTERTPGRTLKARIRVERVDDGARRITVSRKPTPVWAVRGKPLSVLRPARPAGCWEVPLPHAYTRLHQEQFEVSPWRVLAWLYWALADAGDTPYILRSLTGDEVALLLVDVKCWLSLWLRFTAGRGPRPPHPVTYLGWERADWGLVAKLSRELRPPRRSA
jgi:hypothetical protein